jgi:hypothetical protein
LVDVLQSVSHYELIEEVRALSEVEVCRLYVGETLYLWFFIYRAITGRLVFLFEQGREKGEVRPWYQDSGVRQLLTSVVTQKELQEFDGKKFGQLTWIQSLLESKILQHANRIVSGEESADFGFAQAQRIAELAARKNE